MSWTQETVHALVEKQRAFFRTGATLDANWRIAQLKKLKQAVLDHRELLEQALYEDLRKSPIEAYLVDIGPVIVEVNEILHGLRRWREFDEDSIVLIKPNQRRYWTKIQALEDGASIFSDILSMKEAQNG